eukprot:1158963-Pelagomonas_calceolata.AAC.1
MLMLRDTGEGTSGWTGPGWVARPPLDLEARQCDVRAADQVPWLAGLEGAQLIMQNIRSVAPLYILEPILGLCFCSLSCWNIHSLAFAPYLAGISTL